MVGDWLLERRRASLLFGMEWPSILKPFCKLTINQYALCHGQTMVTGSPPGTKVGISNTGNRICAIVACTKPIKISHVEVCYAQFLTHFMP